MCRGIDTGQLDTKSGGERSYDICSTENDVWVMEHLIWCKFNADMDFTVASQSELGGQSDPFIKNFALIDISKVHLGFANFVAANGVFVKDLQVELVEAVAFGDIECKCLVPFGVKGKNEFKLLFKCCNERCFFYLQTGLLVFLSSLVRCLYLSSNHNSLQGESF